MSALPKPRLINEGLGQAAENFANCNGFWCTGDLTSPESCQLVYKGKPEAWCGVRFPGATKQDLKQLVEACSPAGFGTDDCQVTDRSYRNACKLNPDQFMTNFQISNTSILGEIVATMVPNLHQIGAELYKLNVYTKGGLFKAQVDTPRPNTFGSLVVCLPTHFSGGQLVTRHDGSEVTFDWSTPPLSPKKNISWAAFSKVVEHEILPVTGGYRVTLTYSLCRNKEGSLFSPFHPTVSSNFAGELSAALSSPVFLREGGVLGFGVHHDFFLEKPGDPRSMNVWLKGSDRVVYVTAISLGLSVLVKPVIMQTGGGTRYLLSVFPNEYSTRDGDMCEEDENEPYALYEMFETVPHSDKYITWCQELTRWKPVGARIHWDCHWREKLVSYKQAVAILIGVPKWGEARRKCVSGSPGASTSPSSGQEPKASSEVPKTAKKPRKRSRTSVSDDTNKDSESVLQRLCFHGEDASADMKSFKDRETVENPFIHGYTPS